MPEKFMLIGEDWSGVLEVWGTDFKYPYIVRVREPGQVNGFKIWIFRNPEDVDQLIDAMEANAVDRE